MFPVLSRWTRWYSVHARFLLLLLLTFAVTLRPLPAQSDAPSAQTQPPATAQQKPSEAPPAEAGGPQGDVGPYAVPKKKEEAPPPPPPPAPKKVPGMPDYSIRVNVPLVTVDTLVATKDGHFIP